jgi:hypothetical protein
LAHGINAVSCDSQIDPALHCFPITIGACLLICFEFATFIAVLLLKIETHLQINATIRCLRGEESSCRLAVILKPINDLDQIPKMRITFREFIERYRSLKLVNKKETTIHAMKRIYVSITSLRSAR